MPCEVLDLDEGVGVILRKSAIIYQSTLHHIPEYFNSEDKHSLYDAETWTLRKADQKQDWSLLA